MKVDFKSFPTSTHGPQSTSEVKSYARWKFLLRGRCETERAAPFAPQMMLWSNPDPIPFLSSQPFLRKTKARTFPLFKYNGQEFKNEFI